MSGQSRWSLIALALITASVMVVGVASATSHIGEQTYTACLTNGGDLVSVAVGEEPKKACSRQQTEVSWNAAGVDGVAGTNGTDGTDGESCTVDEDPAGTFTLSCGSTEVSWIGSPTTTTTTTPPLPPVDIQTSGTHDDVTVVAYFPSEWKVGTPGWFQIDATVSSNDDAFTAGDDIQVNLFEDRGVVLEPTSVSMWTHEVSSVEAASGFVSLQYDCDLVDFPTDDGNDVEAFVRVGVVKDACSGFCVQDVADTSVVIINEL